MFYFLNSVGAKIDGPIYAFAIKFLKAKGGGGGCEISKLRADPFETNIK